MHTNPTSGVILEKDRRGHLEKVRCARCGGSALGGGDQYLRGWIDGHLPICDPAAYVTFLMEAR